MRNETIADVPVILIVDDEPSARETLEALLFQERYALHFAANGREALEQIAVVAPDVILLDVMMPDMTGYELCEILSSNAETCRIPIVLITALDTGANLVRGLESGATEFLSKPVSGVELRTRVRSMLRIKQQTDKLREALTLHESFAQMIVHDMRHPLAAITVATHMLQKRGESPPVVAKSAATIQTSTARLVRFLEELLLAKMEAGHIQLAPRVVDLGDLCAQAQAEYELVATSRNVTLVTQTPDESCQVAVDDSLFRRVLDNLLINAIDYAPEQSSVTLQCGRRAADGEQDAVIWLRVIDEGPGVSDVEKLKIFDRFAIGEQAYRGHTHVEIGLGLAFCNLVVADHAGRIHVTDHAPHGSIFHVELPVPAAEEVLPGHLENALRLT